MAMGPFTIFAKNLDKTVDNTLTITMPDTGWFDRTT